MKRIIYIALALLAVALDSCTDSNVTRLKDEINSANAQCPMAIDNGITMTGVTYRDNDLVATFLLDNDYYDMDIIRSNMQAYMDGMVAIDTGELGDLFTLCRKAKANIIMEFVSTDDSRATGTIPWQKMIPAP